MCAGCGNGEGHVAPVYAKWSVALVFVVLADFQLKWPLEPLVLLGVPWVSPGCLLGVSWVLLGASWVLLGDP